MESALCRWCKKLYCSCRAIQTLSVKTCSVFFLCKMSRIKSNSAKAQPYPVLANIAAVLEENTKLLDIKI